MLWPEHGPDPRSARARASSARLPCLLARARGWADLARRDPRCAASEHGLHPAGLLGRAAVPGRLPPRGNAGLAVVVRQEPQPRLRRRQPDRERRGEALRRRLAARGAERPLRRRVGGAVGALSPSRRAPVDPGAPRGLGRPDDRRALGGGGRRGRHRPPPPAALPQRRVLGRLLPAVPRRPVPRGLGSGARGPRSDASPAERGAARALPRYALLPLDRPEPRPRNPCRDDRLRAAAPRTAAPLAARAPGREARPLGAAARRPPGIDPRLRR